MNRQNTLPGWVDEPARSAVLKFIQEVTTPGVSFVPPPERIATFDNDGTLWCEKPLYIQADFLFRRFKAMVREDPQRAHEQPYKAVVEDDREWLMDIYAHVPELLKGVTEASGGITVEAFEAAARDFFESARHPTLGVPYTEVTYRPMRELIALLAAHDFQVYVCSAGGRDFVRPVSEQLYGIPRDRVIGSATTLEYRDGDLYRAAGVEQPIDDGPGKPVHIWTRTGRKPLCRRQRRRRRRDAGDRALRAPRAPRRRGARVRLRPGRREGARRCRGLRLERGQHEGGFRDGLLIGASDMSFGSMLTYENGRSGGAMAGPFKGVINVDIRDSTPDWAPFESPKAPDGAPSVVYIVLDDVGFSAVSCYGGPIPTPNIDKLAAEGVRTRSGTPRRCVRRPVRAC